MSTAPKFSPEKNRIYAKNSLERFQIQAALLEFIKNAPYEVKSTSTDDSASKIKHVNPANHATALALFSPITEKLISEAVRSALKAKESWAVLSFRNRAAVFLRSADLIAAKFRNKLTSALILGQGMDVRQAEVTLCDLIDFLRFNVECAEKVYAQQPQIHAPGVWNAFEYSALEGFVFAKLSSNDLAAAANFVCAPALMGNVVVWMPHNATVLTSQILLEVLQEAGMPHNVIQLLPGASDESRKSAVYNPDLGAVAFSGPLPKLLDIQDLLNTCMKSEVYHTFPRLIAETDGNSYHLLHPVCDFPKATSNTVRAAFEYQGQKKNSISVAYVPSSSWISFKAQVTTATENLSVGPTVIWKNFMGAVIDGETFERLKALLKAAEEDKDLELISGGKYDNSTGYFIYPTIYATRNKSHHLLSSREPIQGPILVICVYDDESVSVEEAWLTICKHVKKSLPSIRSGSIFATDRQAISLGTSILQGITGNLCINTRCNAPQVAQSSFGGGGRLSGTGEMMGTVSFLERFVNTCSVKEELLGGYHVIYASHVE